MCQNKIFAPLSLPLTSSQWSLKRMEILFFHCLRHIPGCHPHNIISCRHTGRKHLKDHKFPWSKWLYSLLIVVCQEVLGAGNWSELFSQMSYDHSERSNNSQKANNIKPGPEKRKRDKKKPDPKTLEAMCKKD